MRNPLKAADDWLHGRDLQPPPTTTAPEQKLHYIDDLRGALTTNTMLVHGPGASGTTLTPDSNDAVFACLMTWADAYSEAPLRVMRETEPGKTEWLPEAPWQALLDHPNDFMDIGELLHWTTWVKRLDGNAYWRKIRSGDPIRGNVVELWPISPLLCRPVRYQHSNAFIDAYRFKWGPRVEDSEDIHPRNIIHFKLGTDDRDHRVGLSAIKRLVRQVAGDEAASQWASSMLANGGAMGMIVTPPADSTLTPEQAKELKARIQAEFGGDSRGKVGVLAPGAKAEPYGFAPEQMDMRSLHYIPETRIAAVMRVPAVVVGLSAGLEKSGQYSNFREAREQFTESGVLPAYQFDARKITHSLREDFTTDRRVSVRFDTSDMRVLQEDEDRKYARLNVGVAGGGYWIRPSEARADVGLPPDPELDVLWSARAGAQSTMPAKMTPAAKLLALAMERKADVSLDELPDLLQALVNVAVPGFEREMEQYLDGQRRRVVRRLTEAS